MPASRRVPVTAPAGERPPGVTFACVASIVYGSLAIALAALSLLFLVAFTGAMAQATAGWMLVFWPAAILGWLGAILAVFALVVFLPIGILGLVAGIHGLQGAAWARWMMVALYGLGALALAGGAMAVFPLALVALNVVAIVMLVNAPASEWFERMRA